MEIKYKDFIISDDKFKIQINKVCELLSSSYWAKDRQKETIEKSIKNSICFGVYKDDIQVGFARCVTDYATVYWLADVIINECYQGLGLGKALIDTIVNHIDLKGCFGILKTADAHNLYRKYGFELDSEKFMFKPKE